MSWFLIGFGVIPFGLLVFFLAGLKVVQEQERWVIERFGAFHRVLHRGLNWTFPILDKVRAVVSVWEQSVQLFPGEPGLDFRDGGTAVLIDPRTWYRIIDPRRAIYNVTDYKTAMREAVENSLTARFGRLSVDETIEERTKLGEDGWWRAVKEQSPGIEEVLEGWGLKIERVTITDFRWDETVVRKRAEVFEAERGIEISEYDSKAAKWKAIEKALVSGGMHGEIVRQLTASPYDFSREEAERVATDYVTYFKGADTGSIIDWRGGGGDIASLVAMIVTGIEAAREAQRKRQKKENEK